MAYDFSNYRNTWNNSSVLQNQFPNVNDYLSLFGAQGNTPPPSSAGPYPVGAPEGDQLMQKIPNIINSNINQGGGGIGGLTLNTPRTATASPINSPAFRDPLNEKIMNQIRNEGMTIQGKNVPYSNRTYENQLNKYTDAEFMEANPDMFDIKTDRGMFQNTIDNVGNFVGGIAEFAGNIPTPGKMIGNVLGGLKPKLSELDVAFNKSGDSYTSAGGIGNKDKYGINKVSGFGNYADYVGTKSTDLEDAYAAALDKYTKMGLTPQQIAKKTKSLKERRDYYAAQEKKRQDAIDAKKAQDLADFEKEKAANKAFQDAMADQKSFYASLNDGRGASSTQEGRDNAGGGAAANRGDEGSGWDSSPFARGGRVSLKNGGLATMFKLKG